MFVLAVRTPPVLVSLLRKITEQVTWLPAESLQIPNAVRIVSLDSRRQQRELPTLRNLLLRLRFSLIDIVRAMVDSPRERIKAERSIACRAYIGSISTVRFSSCRCAANRASIFTLMPASFAWMRAHLGAH